MKVSKAQVQANRAHIVETASALFRERGYEGVGVAELMAAAGFTHGGFYKHFGSKADLMAEASACGLAQTAAKTEGLDVQAFLAMYLSREHRDNPADGCTLAALSADAGRQPEAVKEVFAQGLEQMVQGLSRETDAAEQQAQRSRRLSVMAMLVGALALSRACPDDSALANEVLEACRQRLSLPS